jgi:hypothetical protein
MTTHHTSLYDDKTNPAPNGVLKQELVTLEQTPDGIRITRLKRRFSGDAVNISFESERKERIGYPLDYGICKRFFSVGNG